MFKCFTEMTPPTSRWRGRRGVQRAGSRRLELSTSFSRGVLQEGGLLAPGEGSKTKRSENHPKPEWFITWVYVSCNEIGVAYHKLGYVLICFCVLTITPLQNETRTSRHPYKKRFGHQLEHRVHGCIQLTEHEVTFFGRWFRNNLNHNSYMYSQKLLWGSLQPLWQILANICVQIDGRR